MSYTHAALKLRLTISLAAALLASAASFAFAAPSARLVYLRNPGAEACPDESNVRAAVSARLGYDPFFPSATSTMFAEISREREGYRARIKLVDDTNSVRGTRELSSRGPRCEEIIDVMALSMSIAIDPTSLHRAPGAPPPTSVDDAPQPTRAPDAAPATEAREESIPRASTTAALSAIAPASADRVARSGDTERVHVTMSAGGAVWLEAAPAPNVSAHLAAATRWRRVSVALEGRLDAPANANVAAGEVSTSLVGGALAPCVHFPSGVATPKLCGVAFVGAMRARGERILTSRTDEAIHGTVGPRVGIDVDLGAWLAAYGQIEGAVAMTRHDVQISGVTAHETSLFAASAGAGLIARLF